MHQGNNHGRRAAGQRAWRRACVLATAGLLVGSTAAASGYRCLMSNGRSLLSAQNLAESFPAGVILCNAEGGGAPVRLAALEGKRPRIVQVDYPTSLWSPPVEPAPALPVFAEWGAGLAGKVDFAAIDGFIVATSAKHGLDPDLIRAIVTVESGGKARAVSNKGAIGLMQIMPGTGARYGAGTVAELMVPNINVEAGIRYVRDLTKMFSGKTELVLAAYNAGEGAVMKYGWQIPPYAETRDYVKKVLAHYERLVAQRTRARLAGLP